MKRIFIFLIAIASVISANAQELKLKKRNPAALTGTEFAKLISDTSLTLTAREELIFKEIKSGNVPSFLRKLSPVTMPMLEGLSSVYISYYVLPDYLSIGSDNDFFYCPMTPMLAQRVADLTKCVLPTKKMVDQIYNMAKIKLEPLPIAPSKLMTTVPVFVDHNNMLINQLAPYNTLHNTSALTAGNKKDIILSNKIYGEPTPRVVIYGWHKKDGIAIQPVYNKHTNTWADYSHGVRLIQSKAFVDQKKTSIEKILADSFLSKYLSDEGEIKVARYPFGSP